MEKATFILIGLIAVFGSYGIGLIEGTKLSDQAKADAYFAGQEEAIKACKGEVDYE